MSPIRLSSHGLDGAASASEGAFAFIGNRCQIQCTQFQAAFISPRVQRLLQEDPTMSSFFIEYQTHHIEEKRIFAFLERLAVGFPIETSGFDVSGLLEVASFLGNSELVEQLLDDEGTIDESTVWLYLRTKSALGVSMENEIKFAALCLHKLGFEQLKGMDISIIERIISSRSLCLRNEDSLLDFICGLESKSRVLLLRYVHSEYLSTEKMESFIELVSGFSVDPFIWASLCRRLRLRVPPRRSRSRARQTVEIRMRNASSCGKSERLERLDGLLSFLTRESGGNIHAQGIVTLSSSSFSGDDNWHLKSFADCFSGRAFLDQAGLGEWIRWDFHEMRVRPVQYSIRASNLRMWVIEGSEDGRRWTTLGQRTDADDFEYGPCTSCFAMSMTGEFRFLRLAQIGGTGSTSVSLSAVEFFGTLSGYVSVSRWDLRDWS
jgi:hypothetical protein